MREIQQAVRVLLHALAHVLKLKSEERYEEAIRQIDEALGGLELSPRPIVELDTAAVLDLCRTDRGFSVELALAIADLLREEADVLSRMGEGAAARRSAVKALGLYRESLDTEGAALPLDIGRRIEVLEALIRDADQQTEDASPS